MHFYEQQVTVSMQSAQPDGRGGYLRIKSDRGVEHARTILTEENEAARTDIDNMQGPHQVISQCVAMQMLIVTSLLLRRLDQPIDIRALNLSQHGSRRTAESLEEAISGLTTMFPQTFEVVVQL